MPTRTTRRTKSLYAYQRIEEGLQNGAFAAGKRLTENALSKKYNVGRVPVREALLRLEAEGLLKDRGPHRGMCVEFVEDLKPEEILDRYEAREVVECKAAWLAAKNMTGWQIDQLREYAENYAKCSRQSNREASLEASRAFQEYLMAECGNGLLHEMWQTYHLAPLTVRSVQTEARIFGETYRSHPEEDSDRLLAIVDAIASHDQELAENAMRGKVRKITERLRKFLANGNG